MSNPYGREVVMDLLRRFPESPSRTLAAMAYKQNSKLWSSLEACRCQVRLYRGQHGRHNREGVKVTEFRTGRGRCTGVPAIPKGLTDLHDYKPHILKLPARILILADLHCPYHDDQVIEIACQDALDNGVDTLVLLGDIADHYSLSRWMNDPRRRDYKKELETIRSLRQYFDDVFKGCTRIAKLGNHDERLEAYLSLKAPELYDVPEFQLAKLWGLEDTGWTIVTDLKPLRAGGLYLIHGHEYRFQIANPVNPARGLFLRSKEMAMCAHFHQTSQHSENSMGGKVISCWSVGCACDLHPKYMPLNKWNLGYAIIQIDANGAFQVENKRIIDGKAYA